LDILIMWVNKFLIYFKIRFLFSSLGNEMS
jgi:hypothetical protein